MTGLDGEPERVVVKRVNPVDGGLERDFVEQEGLMLERLQGLRNYCNSVPLYGTTCLMQATPTTLPTSSWGELLVCFSSILVPCLSRSSKRCSGSQQHHECVSPPKSVWHVKLHGHLPPYQHDTWLDSVQGRCFSISKQDIRNQGSGQNAVYWF